MTAALWIMGGIAVFFVVLPPAAMFFLKSRGGRWMDFFTGAGIFFLFVMVLEALLHNFVLLATPLGAALESNIWLYGLYGGLAAGIFEEVGRYAAFRFLLKSHRSRVTALGYGVGHGGCEAILLLSVTYLSNIALMAAAQSGTALPQEAQAVASQLAALPAATFLWAALERVSAIALHIALSVLVFAAVTRPGKRGLFFAAVALHAAMDFIAVVCNAFFPIAVTELLVAAFAAATVWFAVKIYRTLPEHADGAAAA